MTISAIRYDSPEALGAALIEAMGTEERECHDFTAGAKESGAGAWVGHDGSIHFWASNQEDTATLVALFALEIASMSGRLYTLNHDDQMEACNHIASIAVRAHKLAMQFRDGGESTVVIRAAGEALH